MGENVTGSKGCIEFSQRFLAIVDARFILFEEVGHLYMFPRNSDQQF